MLMASGRVESVEIYIDAFDTQPLPLRPARRLGTDPIEDLFNNGGPFDEDDAPAGIETLTGKLKRMFPERLEILELHFLDGLNFEQASKVTGRSKFRLLQQQEDGIRFLRYHIERPHALRKGNPT